MAAAAAAPIVYFVIAVIVIVVIPLLVRPLNPADSLFSVRGPRALSLLRIGACVALWEKHFLQGSGVCAALQIARLRG
jgi:hypothetical protein